jgi:hypothetical protein
MEMIDSKTDVTLYRLTKGIYEPEEVRDLLIKKLEQEFQFHKLQNYVRQIRYEEECMQAKRNIEVLPKASNEIREEISKAKSGNYN